MTAQSFSILNISLSIGNHLNAFSSRVFNRDISGHNTEALWPLLRAGESSEPPQLLQIDFRRYSGPAGKMPVM